MALARLDASTATIGGIAPIPLFGYNCTGGGGATDFDMTLGPKGWGPPAGAGLVCHEVAGADGHPSPAMYVLPVRAGPAAASLVELSVWYKPSDHYVVASAAGVADARAEGYVRQMALGHGNFDFAANLFASHISVPRAA